MQDFAKTIRWALPGVIPPEAIPPMVSVASPEAGVKVVPAVRKPLSQREEMMKGEKINVEKTVLRNNTGITALSLNAAFFAVS